MSSIVVGMDGSTGAQRALNWAVNEAALRRCPVRAIYVIDRRYLDSDLGVLVAPAASELEAEARAILDRAVGAIGEVPEGVDLRKEVVHAERHGIVGTLLDQAGQDAELFVVGSRGHGGFAGLLLGSVSHQVLQHASCPVVVVPHGREG
ncbi:universal stress protein [Halorhodospira halophila]|uniref:UspA domain protein n=1 Tax=Halorhodospira halophila (strain DSM 244 / SL1) TaxID=349124 RepID=A1WZ42_HALHL|nr:universal stress protein [Halorhodospira halophila]ABM62954.1 UspA domain protein [Halorhodospira halophila SL1]MBK1727925.1 universal stress protein [Halorhodospira halophila]